ncbi:MAG: hypothetical protein R3E64_17160 [Halioglobus sp.]
MTWKHDVYRPARLAPFLALLTVQLLLASTTAVAAAWVAVGENGTIIYSADGINWSNAVSPTAQTLRGVDFDGAGTWAAAGQNGTIVSSTDAINWAQQSSGNTDALWGTTFAGGQWIVSGGNGRIVTSPDSMAWTSVNSGYAFTLFDIAYDGSGLYAISGDSGFAPSLLTSNDAVTWSQRTPNPNNGEGLYGIAYGAGKWVAVGDVGTILTSVDPDSRTWTTETSGTSEYLRDIIYNGSNLYVAVGEGGVILTSADASIWTPRSSGTTSDLWGVEYDGAGLYVIVGFDGTILSSTDAIHWTPRTSPTSQRLRDVGVGRLPPPPAPPTPVPTLPLPLLTLLALLVAGVGKKGTQLFFKRKSKE